MKFNVCINKNNDITIAEMDLIDIHTSVIPMFDPSTNTDCSKTCIVFSFKNLINKKEHHFKIETKEKVSEEFMHQVYNVLYKNNKDYYSIITQKSLEEMVNVIYI